MHTYRKSGKDEGALWTVGYFDPQNASRWHPLRDFGDEGVASAYANYLNGGEGVLWVYHGAFK